MSNSLKTDISEISPLLGKDIIQPSDGAISEENGTVDDTDDQNPTPREDPPLLQIILKMSGCWLGVFLAALDSTIIATLSAPVSASFQSLSLLSWLAASYFIANAAFQPISGRITDILSRRTGLVFSNTCFGLGNLICGLARTEREMILGRVVAGLGGGGLSSIATFVGSDLVPLRKRGMWQGIGNIIFGVGAGLGGVIGGWLNDKWDWRVAFLAQVPLTVVSGLLVLFTLRLPKRETKDSAWKRIDFLGASLLITTLVLLLLGLNSGGNTVPWTHPLVWASLSLAAVFLGLFVYVESNYAAEPVIPVKKLVDRTVLSACLTNWFGTMCVFSLLFYGPIYFQVRGLSPTQAGARLIPQAIGGGLGSISSGLMMRWTGRYYLLSVGEQSAFVASLVMISTFTLTTPGWEHFFVLFLFGFGYSSMLTVTLIALVSAVSQEDQAVITSASYAFRSTGSSIGITIASAVFQNILDKELRGRLGGRKGAAEIIARLRDNLDEIRKVPPEWKNDVMDIYMDALRGVFLTVLGIGILGLAVSLGMRENKLHNTLARK